MTLRLPALFIGHGSPMNAITDNPYRRSWESLSARFAKPKAIICVSAHWETKGAFVTTSTSPRTLHDFYGFPDALFAMRYPAPGAKDLASQVMALTGAKGDDALPEPWGLDHGAWSVLASLYPDADIPVIQFSLDRTRTPQEHYALARKFAPLREDGVLVLGSGNIVHNLRYFRDGPQHYDWAERIDRVIKEKIRTGDHAALADYSALDPDISLAIPTDEHYLPLLYALGAKHESDTTEIFNDDVIASISMTSVALGL